MLFRSEAPYPAPAADVRSTVLAGPRCRLRVSGPGSWRVTEVARHLTWGLSISVHLTWRLSTPPHLTWGLSTPSTSSGSCLHLPTSPKGPCLCPPNWGLRQRCCWPRGYLRLCPLQTRSPAQRGESTHRGVAAWNCWWSGDSLVPFWPRVCPELSWH